MAKLRFRIELNKGGVGVSMSKLASITAETEKFLQMLVSDIVIEDINGQWIAKDFDNNSVDFNNEYVGVVTIPDELHFNEAVDFITAEEIDFNNKPAKIRSATLLQYSNIAKSIGADEAIVFGIFNGNGDGLKAYRSLSKQHASDIQQKLKSNDIIEYLGSIQGVIHSVITEGNNTSFKIRGLYSGNLITCFYNKSQYNNIVSILKKQGATVHVQGWIKGSQAEQKPLYMQVDKIEPAVEYREGDLDTFIGVFSDVSDVNIEKQNTDKR